MQPPCVESAAHAAEWCTVHWQHVNSSRHQHRGSVGRRAGELLQTDAAFCVQTSALKLAVACAL